MTFKSDSIGMWLHLPPFAVRMVAVMLLMAQTPALLSGAPPLRIMALGDSITVGYTDNPGWKVPFRFGYRSKLCTLLTKAGYNFRIVGKSTELWTGVSGDPTHGNPAYRPSAPDLRALGQDGHRGYGGASIGAIHKRIAGWLQADDPDVILLLIGINGIGPSSPAQLDALVGTIVKTKPEAHLIVAQITPLFRFNRSLVDYNTYIRDKLVPHYAGRLGKNVSTVDHYANFVNAKGEIDKSLFSNRLNHPSNRGYDRMAETWLAGIKTVKAPAQRAGSRQTPVRD